MQFWAPKDYKKQYGLTPKDLAKVIENQFIPSLERSIANELKVKGRKSTNNEIGQGVKPTSEKAEETKDTEEVIVSTNKKKETTGNESEEEPESEAEGDGDVAETEAKKKKKQQSTYDESESEGEDDENSEDEIDQASQEEQIEVETEQAKRIVVDAKFVSEYLFDKAGQWCEISLNFSADTQKLLMVALVENVAWNVIIHRIPGIDRCFPQPNDNENDTSVHYY